MALAAHRCMMTAPKAPLVRSAYDAVPQAGEVLVEVAGCGVCHTDLGYFYDGVRTNHPLPLALGHEISGKVVAAGDGAAEWVLDSKVQLKPFVEAHPLNDINHVFEAVHHRDIKRRAVMVPAN